MGCSITNDFNDDFSRNFIKPKHKSGEHLSFFYLTMNTPDLQNCLIVCPLYNPTS